jgi:hypothetical protein
VLNKDIALFPPVVLDNLSASSWWESGNNVLKHYIPAIDETAKPLTIRAAKPYNH